MPAKRKSKAAATPVRRAARKPDPVRYAYLIEAGLLLVLMAGGTIFTLSYLRKEAPPPPPPPMPIQHFADVIEMESLPIVGKSREFNVMVQDMSDFREGTWSGNQQYLITNTKLDDWVEWGLPDLPGRFQLFMYFTKARDYGIVQVMVNGRNVGPPQNLISNGPVLSTGPIELGRVKLKAKDNRLRVVVTGVDPATATRTYFFGIDAIKLVREK